MEETETRGFCPFGDSSRVLRKREVVNFGTMTHQSLKASARPKQEPFEERMFGFLNAVVEPLVCAGVVTPLPWPQRRARSWRST